MLRHRVGDAMHARRPLAQAHQNVGRDLRKIALGRPHLNSLRRNDPDQVRWVGVRLSARLEPGTP